MPPEPSGACLRNTSGVDGAPNHTNLPFRLCPGATSRIHDVRLRAALTDPEAKRSAPPSPETGASSDYSKTVRASQSGNMVHQG
jgi:hypothetical protein